jgi:hypothetical protein
VWLEQHGHLICIMLKRLALIVSDTCGFQQ